MRPNSPEPHRDVLTASQADAVDWALKRQQGPWTEIEEKAFRAWLADNPGNQSAMAQCEAVNAALQNVQAGQLADLRAQLLIDKSQLDPSPPPKTKLKPLQIAAMACLPMLLIHTIASHSSKPL